MNPVGYLGIKDESVCIHSKPPACLFLVSGSSSLLQHLTALTYMLLPPFGRPRAFEVGAMATKTFVPSLAWPVQ